MLKSERLHISFFGKVNTGKSSLINALTNQEMSIVSSVPGTTTDPVNKSMEILPIGPVVLIDTPGYDDFSELGSKRIERTNAILNDTSIAIVVVDAIQGISTVDEEFINKINKKSIPYIIVYNKSDLTENINDDAIYVSSKTKDGLEKLLDAISGLNVEKNEQVLASDLVNEGDLVVLVVPIDESAPKDRIILPQQMAVRNLIEAGNPTLVVTEKELEYVMNKYVDDVKLVITDSQVFSKVDKLVPGYIPLTSFSILMMRKKGNLKACVDAVKILDSLSEGDRILISEGCTHRRQCGDIGTVKLPNMIRQYTKKDFDFVYTSGNEFDSKIDDVKLVIHCGGCMLSDEMIKSRISLAKEKNIPFTNYGTTIAYVNGILERSIFMLH